MSRLNYGHRSMLAVVDLCRDGSEVMTTEDVETKVRKHARLAGHALNPKTRTREVEKAREQLYQAGVIESAGNEAFRLTDLGEQIVNGVKTIRTRPCRTSKQWDGHLKKQRDEVKKYVTFVKLPGVVELCVRLRQEREDREELQDEGGDMEVELEELEDQLDAENQLFGPNPSGSQSRSVSPASEASFQTALARPATPTGDHHGNDGTQNRGVSTPPATPARRGLTAGGSFVIGGLLTPRLGCGVLDGDDDMAVDDEVARMLMATSSRSLPITPTLQRSFSLNNPQAYPTPASAARPNAEAGPSRSPLERSPEISPSARRSGLQAEERGASRGILDAIKKRLFSLIREPTTLPDIAGDIQEEIEEPQDLESVVGLVEERLGQLQDDIKKGKGREEQHVQQVRDLESSIAKLQEELKNTKAENVTLSQRVDELLGKLAQVSAISSNP